MITSLSSPRTVLLPLLFAIPLIALIGCDNSPPKPASSNSSDQKILIVATTGMVADLVNNLMGELADVSALMGPGVDPHLYQPSRGDAVELLNAEAVVYNGLHLEGRLGEVIERRQSGNGITIAVGELLDKKHLLDADAGLYDPHIWMDVSLWNEAAGILAEELSQSFPEHADVIRTRTEEYQRKLKLLDNWGAQAIESIPESQRVMITAHDAFRYFGRRYGVEVHGVQGVSTASEAAISDTNRLVDLIVERKVPGVFFESSVSPRQVKAIVEGARKRGHEVSSDSTLLSDSMGSAGSSAGTYIGMMRHNFEMISTTLGGSVPEDVTDEQDTPAAQIATQIGYRITLRKVSPMGMIRIEQGAWL